ncbi:DNA-directed RNA polymerases I, II, and III subunit RPABC4-like [Theropithecus gelada]|uniref:DNA-directed RNA polymerases I, II, and III subunit RPABC4-like n=1 Tax=Theropithecus gelada TaxID=9565 RepID=UPI000DC15FA5|nr:DNA-directed RNA polymerases I, II, and III subunit RPABC4-like [Theropithecus gelada]
MDTQKDVQPPKQKPMTYICGECHTENKIKYRDPIRFRECGYKITYKKRTTRLAVFMLDETWEFKEMSSLILGFVFSIFFIVV